VSQEIPALANSLAEEADRIGDDFADSDVYRGGGGAGVPGWHPDRDNVTRLRRGWVPPRASPIRALCLVANFKHRAEKNFLIELPFRPATV
jgi:hypothetical protein